MKWFAIFLLMLGSSFAQELAKERIWTGTNGKTFRGIFIRALEDDAKVEIASAQGKLFTIAIENLSESDRKLIEEHNKPSTPAVESTPTEKFRPIPHVDRVLISKAPNKADGFKWQGSAIQAIGGFLYWWHISNYIEIPRSGDAEKQCDWITDKLKRKVSVRNTSLPSHEDIMAGMAHYFDEELKDSASFRFHLVVDPTPAKISEFTSTGDACFIQVFNDGFGVWFPVIDVQGDDLIRVAYEGKILTLKWTAGTETDRYISSGKSFNIPIPRSEPVPWDPYRDYFELTKKKPRDLTMPVLEVMNKEDAPTHWKGDELIFQIRPSRPMIVCRPYAFAKTGKASLPPLEPGFGPQPKGT